LFGGVFFALAAFFCDGVSNLVCYASPCCAGAENDDAEVGQFGFCYVQSGHDCCEGDAACALDIVVEAGYIGPILFENSPCIWKTKVLAVRLLAWNITLNLVSYKWIYARG